MFAVSVGVNGVKISSLVVGIVVNGVRNVLTSTGVDLVDVVSDSVEISIDFVVTMSSLVEISTPPLSVVIISIGFVVAPSADVSSSLAVDVDAVDDDFEISEEDSVMSLECSLLLVIILIPTDVDDDSTPSVIELVCVLMSLVTMLGLVDSK
jgi:hypothetical protein